MPGRLWQLLKQGGGTWRFVFVEESIGQHPLEQQNWQKEYGKGG